jgi:hypothetical protein
MALKEEQIAALKAEHGVLIGIESDAGYLVFKKPSRALWSEFTDKLSHDRDSRAAAFRRVALACGVYPSADALAAIFEEYPGIPPAVTDELSKLIGLGKEFEVKKL